MKKEAIQAAITHSGKTHAQAVHKVVPLKESDDDDAMDADDLYTVDKEDNEYFEPKGPEKSDLKKNIVFIDDDEEFDDEF